MKRILDLGSCQAGETSPSLAYMRPPDEVGENPDWTQDLAVSLVEACHEDFCYAEIFLKKFKHQGKKGRDPGDISTCLGGVEGLLTLEAVGGRPDRSVAASICFASPEGIEALREHQQ